MCESDTGCLLTWHPGITGHSREFGIGRRGDYFDVTSERSDGRADISKNIRDVSKPETPLLLLLLLLLRTRRHSSAQSQWLWTCPLRVWMNMTHLFRQRRVRCDLQPAEGKKEKKKNPHKTPEFRESPRKDLFMCEQTRRLFPLSRTVEIISPGWKWLNSLIIKLRTEYVWENLCTLH